MVTNKVNNNTFNQSMVLVMQNHNQVKKKQPGNSGSNAGPSHTARNKRSLSNNMAQTHMKGGTVHQRMQSEFYF